MSSCLARTTAFASKYGLKLPVMLAPMAGACPPSLSIAVGQAGGMGACGALLMSPDQIHGWISQVRSETDAPFQLNTWIPDPRPTRDEAREDAVRNFLGRWGPKVPPDAADSPAPDFDGQCAAMLTARPRVISSIMGLYSSEMVVQMKDGGIAWFATATTVAEARAAEAAGADAIVAQGMEAGGHRGAFNADEASQNLVGLFSLLPAIVDAVDVPVIATGGVADARGVAAAIVLGASAVQVGTGFLRSPEAKIAPAWANAIGDAAPEDTIATRAFSGRLGRSIRTRYAQAANEVDAPEPAPYPIQRSLTQPMRTAATNADTIDGMQAWAGQSSALALAAPAGEIVTLLWEDAQTILSAT